MTISMQDMWRIADRLVDTCSDIEQALIELGIEVTDDAIDEVESRLGDPGINVEQCQGCGWWFECGDLVAHDEEPVLPGYEEGYCESCREDHYE